MQQCFISLAWPDPLPRRTLSLAAYTASDNALRGRGSGHTRLVLHHFIYSPCLHSKSSYVTYRDTPPCQSGMGGWWKGLLLCPTALFRRR